MFQAETVETKQASLKCKSIYIYAQVLNMFNKCVSLPTGTKQNVQIRFMEMSLVVQDVDNKPKHWTVKD